MIQKINISEYSFLNDYRYERKFVLSGLHVSGVEQIVKNHQAYFKEIYQERFINNIYFDTQNLTHYYDNSFGKSQRRKYRIRWYGDLSGNIENPILEIKIKDAFLGTKKSFPLKSFSLNSDNLIQAVKKSILNSNLPENVQEEILALSPTLLNRYKRKYFIDFSKKFRTTIDSEIEYFQISSGNNSFRNKNSDRNSIILELKYNQEDNINASAVSSQFPFRMTKNSKYINGIECFNQVSI
ncbi:MAG: polyphosphate polymerase domain-containing protein [Bacteroidales bacterium]|nr:polyphosphate polymerase domain-containing protein [Bacteroidales bacterium]